MGDGFAREGDKEEKREGGKLLGDLLRYGKMYGLCPNRTQYENCLRILETHNDVMIDNHLPQSWRIQPHPTPILITILPPCIFAHPPFPPCPPRTLQPPPPCTHPLQSRIQHTLDAQTRPINHVLAPASQLRQIRSSSQLFPPALPLIAAPNNPAVPTHSQTQIPPHADYAGVRRHRRLLVQIARRL
jgi:hypothetical protein